MHIFYRLPRNLLQRPSTLHGKDMITPISREDFLDCSAQELQDIIAHHNQKYWQDSDPEISDDDYDFLVQLLAKKAPDAPLLSNVQGPSVMATGTIRHDPPMLSLDKVYSTEELQNWIEKTVRSNTEELLIEPKFDGISALWKDGVLSTRGDGFIGQVITDKLPLIDVETHDGTIPLAQCKNNVLGELLIRLDDFQTRYSTILNANGKPFKNPRNAIGGIVSLKDISSMVTQNARLTLVDYSIFSRHTTADNLRNDWVNILDEIEGLPYPMDGLVIKLADAEYAASLGNTVHHPRGQIAFKFSGVRKSTKLLNVTWSFGKKCLTPVAEFEPIEINGTTIKRATLHNLLNILNRGLQIGDTITIERAGDVIPKVVDSMPGEERRSCIITQCPSCGHYLWHDLPELRCINPECPETRLQNLLAAVRNIGIERLGEPTLRKMMTDLHVRTLKDLFTLTEFDIGRLEGFKELSTQNLYKEIQSARTVHAHQLLAALNIPGIGPNIAKNILKAIPFEELRNASCEKLADIQGIGPERAAALRKELDTQSDLLDELLSCVTLLAPSAEGEQIKICFTGKMPEKRSYYEQIARNAGFEPVDHVTEGTGLLVVADPEQQSSKTSNAKRLGVPIQALDLWLDSVRTFIPKKEKKEAFIQDSLF